MREALRLPEPSCPPVPTPSRSQRIRSLSPVSDSVASNPAIFNTRLIARWPNPSGNLFYVTIEVVDKSPTEIGGRAQGGFRRFIFPPVAADSFAVAPFSLAYYGLHEVRVYHVNTEYAALYESRLQDSRDLNEPATNIPQRARRVQRVQ